MTATATATATTIETFLPVFSGFYCTIWNDVIDSQEEMEIEYYNDEKGIQCEYDDFIIDYSKMHNDLSENITYAIEQRLISLGYIEKMKFQKLVSPKYYNYTNDSINIELSINEDNINKIKETIKNNPSEWTEYLGTHFTSCDGFISFHENNSNVDEWNLDIIVNNNSNNIGWMIDFICEVEEITESELYYDVEFYVGEYMELNLDTE